MKRRIACTVHAALGAGLVCHAGLSPQGADPQTLSALKQTVAALAGKATPPAVDYAKMAEDTIRFGSDPHAISQFNSGEGQQNDPQRPWRNMVGDALAGVDVGEKIDARAADWKNLREQLLKLQPPPPPPQDKKQNSSQKSEDKKKDQKKDKQSGQEKSDSQQGKGDQQKQEGQKGENEGEGQGGSQSPPSQGEGGQGKDGEGSSENSEGSQSHDGDREGKGQKEAKGKSKDPNGVKDFSSGKGGEGKMRDRAKEDDLNPIQDKGAGFGDLGKEKKDQEKKSEAGRQASASSEKGDKQKEAPEGMRMVGGGTGKKEKDGFNTPSGLEALARLDQVRQSDSPALLQQRLQPKDQPPSPGVSGKPW